MNNEYTLIEETNDNNPKEISITLEMLTPPAPRGKQSPNMLLTPPPPPRIKSIKRTTRSNMSSNTVSPPPSPLFRNKSVKLPSPEPNEYLKKKRLPTTPRPMTIKDTPINQGTLVDRIKNTCLSYFNK